MLLVPILAACALGAGQVLLVAWALLCAGDAAHCGARAILSREPARPAVRHALPGVMRAGEQVTIGARTVTVSIAAPSLIPGYSPRVSASADLVRQ